MAEKVVIVDEKGKELYFVDDDVAHNEGLLDAVAVVWVENDKGEVLLQHRTDGRLDHSAAGHVDPGETYEEAAKRELKEELGVEADRLELKGYAAEPEPKAPQGRNVNHFYMVFAYRLSSNDEIKIKVDEVAMTHFTSQEELRGEFDNDSEDNKYTRGAKVTFKIFSQN